VATAADISLPSSIGISVPAASNVTISNGTVRGFALGIIFDDGPHHNALTGLTLTGNIYGINLRNSDDNVITANNVSGNFAGGVYLQSGSERNVFNGNVLNNNAGIGGASGFFVFDSSDNVFTGNEASDNQAFGIWLGSGSTVGGAGANTNTVRLNTFNRNSEGIRINPGSTGNLLDSNTALLNQLDVTDYNLPAHVNTWTGNNFATDNEGDGPNAGYIR
jgi:parallel beta-helix repeat protein